jgi:hypothetical protein
MSTGTTGPGSGAVAVGPIGPTSTFTAPAVGSIRFYGGPTELRSTPFAGSFGGRGPTGPTGPVSAAGAGRFAGAGSFGAHAVVIKAASLTEDGGPPRLGELILCFFIRPKHQEEQLARYEERFHEWTRRFGAPMARRLYYRHAIQSIFDMFTIGVLGALVDWICRRFWGK